MIMLPEKFKQTVRGVHKQKGEEWLNRFPSIIAELESRWSLKLKDVLPLSYNFVASAVREDGSEVVVKLSVPNKELVTEMEALKLYDGVGMCQLLDEDIEQGVLILEKISPGLSLMEYLRQQLQQLEQLQKGETADVTLPLERVGIDERVTRIAAQVFKSLQRPAPAHSSFPSTEKWAKGIERLRQHYSGGTGIFPEAMVAEVEQLFPALHRTMKQPMLLHGDLHHGNILSTADGGWIAIDPKGVIGEAEYNFIQFLLNELPHQEEDEQGAAEEVQQPSVLQADQPHQETTYSKQSKTLLQQSEQILRLRIDIFTEELGLDKQRILSWGYCHALLSAWWSVEDQTDGAEQTIEVAQIFKKMLAEG